MEGYLGADPRFNTRFSSQLLLPTLFVSTMLMLQLSSIILLSFLVTPAHMAVLSYYYYVQTVHTRQCAILVAYCYVIV